MSKLKIDNLTQRLNCSRSFIYREIERGHFPPAFKLGAASRWLESELEAYEQAVTAGATSEQLQDLTADLINARRGDK